MSKRRPPIFIPILLLLGVLGYLIVRHYREREIIPPGTLPGNGTIEATEVDVSALIPGRLTEVRVHEGDSVTTGETLVTLDPRDVVGGLTQAAGNLAAAQAQLAELQAGSRAEDVARAQAQYDAGMRTLQQAKAQRSLVYAGPRKEALAELRALAAQANAQLSLVQAGPRKEDIAQLAASLRQAEALRDLVHAGPRAEDIAGLKAALQQAEATRDLVKAGPRKEDVEQLRAALAQAQSNLDDALDDVTRLEQLAKDGAIAQRQLDQGKTRRDIAAQGLAAAKQKLAAAEVGSRPQEIQAAEDAVEMAHQRLTAAQTGARPEELKAADEAVEVARQRLAAAKAGSRPQEITVADEAAQAARQRLAEAENGARPQELAAADALVAQAQAQADAAHAALALLQHGARKEDIAAARARVAQAQGALTAAQSTVGNTTVCSPLDGKVTVRVLEPGEQVTPGLAILRVADLRHVWLRVYVPETDHGRVKIGQTADIVGDTYAGKRYHGRVTEVSEEPEFTPKNVQTKEERVKLVYGVKIEVDNPDQELKPGMPADAYINVGK